MDIRAMRNAALATLRRLEWAPPLLARLVIGAVFVPTGWGKLHNLPDIVDFFRQLGIPYPELQAPFVSTVELVCGTLVLVGLATRVAAIPLIPTMVVAIVTAIWPQLDTAREIFGKEELHYIALLAYLVVGGAGLVSLDAIVARRLEEAASPQTGLPNAPARDRREEKDSNALRLSGRSPLPTGRDELVARRSAPTASWAAS